MVPIRSLKTWQPLPGVELGDLGLKIGLNTTDNGYSIFNNVRIPRPNMLMGLAQVGSDGTYSRTGRVQAAYSTMLLVRVEIIKVVALQLAQATTIATRYSTVRTQGYGHYSKSDIEVPLMYYKSQHSRLLGLNAQAFALYFASKACARVYQDRRESTPYIHAIVSGLKAYATRTAADGAEDARKCCGGQGYSVLSGLPDIVAVVTPQCSWEGDNIVLYQQTARFLMDCLHSIHQGKDTHPSMSYIIDAISSTAASQSRCTATTSMLLLPETHLTLFRHRAARLLLSTFAAKSKTTAIEGAAKAWNKHMLRLIAAARAHIEVFVLEAYLVHVAAIPDTATRLVMQKNCTLFALSSILGNTDFFEDGYLGLDQADAMREIINGLVEDLVPEAVALTDVWAFSDANLKSAIGVWDGNIYETLMSWTRQLPVNLNLQKEGGGVAGSAWREVIGPMIKPRETNGFPVSGIKVKSNL